jgi:hypothetical protein
LGSNFSRIAEEINEEGFPWRGRIPRTESRGDFSTAKCSFGRAMLLRNSTIQANRGRKLKFRLEWERNDSS